MDKLTNFNIFIGIIVSVLAIYSFGASFLSNNPISKSILGTWTAEYSYPTKTGNDYVKSTTSYFENGKYNVVGTITVVTGKDKTADKIIYKINGAGTWSSNGDILLSTLNSLKSSPIIPKTGSPAMDLILAEKINSLPVKIEDKQALGVTQKVRILSIDSSTAKLITDDALGGSFNIYLQKVNSNI